MVNAQDALTKRIEDILKRDEREVGFGELLDTMKKLMFFETQGYSSISIDLKVKTEFLDLFKRHLNSYVSKLLIRYKRSEINEITFNACIGEILPYFDGLNDSNKEGVKKTTPFKNQENCSLAPQLPANYKFLLTLWTGTVIFLSFLSFLIIRLAVNRIKKNSKEQ